MKKNYFVLPLLLVLGLFFAACNSDTTTNPVASTTGQIYVQSSPSGAQIWVNGSNSNKITPDTVTEDAGSYTVILKLANYKNDTSSVSVTAGAVTSLGKTLVGDQSLTTYGPVKIWESGDPSASHPSGIILKSGLPSSIVSGSNEGVDIYYSTPAVLQLATMFDKNARATSFWLSTANSLTDGVSSPVISSNWLTQIPATTTTYFYLYDNDHHYSKMIITSPGNDGHQFLYVTWIYNNKVDDVRF